MDLITQYKRVPNYQHTFNSTSNTTLKVYSFFENIDSVCARGYSQHGFTARLTHIRYRLWYSSQTNNDQKSKGIIADEIEESLCSF